MSRWMKRLIRKSRCQICKENKLPPDPAQIRLKVQSGIVDIDICDECADFFDKTAEVLNRPGRRAPTGK